MPAEEPREKVRALIVELLDTPPEAREKEIFRELDKLSPDPDYSDYIFHSREFERPNGEIDIHALVEKIFSYEAVQLGNIND